MDFHPSQLPVAHSFQIDDDRKVPDLVTQMIKLGFTEQKGAFQVIMPKEKKVAKKIGYTIMNELNFGLRKAKQERDVRYWIYSYDTDHFSMVLISSKVMAELGF